VYRNYTLTNHQLDLKQYTTTKKQLSANELSNHTEKKLVSCVHLFDTTLECCQINKTNKKLSINPGFHVH